MSREKLERDRRCDEHGGKFEELAKLTGQLAHEIKNPLSTIKINLKLISEGIDSRKNDPDLQRLSRKITVVCKEADRLEHILGSFLNYLDKTEPNQIASDLNEIVSDLIDFYTPQAYSRCVTIRQGLSAGQLICKIDPDMIKQSLLNLFINAQQAMATGGELIVRTRKKGKFAEIEVADTGDGIDENILSKIFDVYYSAKPGGSGLGLSTTKKIIEAHDGSIRVETERGKGASFTISLPLLEEN